MISYFLLAVIAQEHPATGAPWVNVAYLETKREMESARAVLEDYVENVGPLPMEPDVETRLDVLGSRLGPAYQRRLPAKDAWGRPLRCWAEGRDLFLRSDGPDGVSASTPFGPVESEWSDDLILPYETFEPPVSDSIDRLRGLGLVMEGYRAAHGAYPGPTNGVVPVSRLQELLEDDDGWVLPMLDPWGNPILVISEPEAYALVSWGSNGIPEGEYDPSRTYTWPGAGGGNITPERDLILTNGVFKRDAPARGGR